ncbi:subtilisin-like protease SBT3.1 [Capsicum chacoense]
MAQDKYFSSITLTFLFLISHFLFIIAYDLEPIVDPIVDPPVAKTSYIVFTKNHDYVKILASVLGSEEAAKPAILYNYHEIVGFSALLTPEEASRLSDQEGVLHVYEDRYLDLDKGLEVQINN